MSSADLGAMAGLAEQLPERTPAAEDAFVARWRGGPAPAGGVSDGAEDPQAQLLGLVIAAVEQRRPTLAARLVGLLEINDGDDLHPAVRRAQQAAALLLRAGGPAAEQAFTEEVEGLRSPMVLRALRRLRRGGSPRDPRRGRR